MPDGLADRLAPRGVSGLRPLAGGASSLTFAGDLDGRPVVVKVAPPGVSPTAHRDVLRQARIIRALGPTAVPVPEVLLEDAGDPPGVPPLFVMSRLAGESFEPLFDAPGGTADDAVAQRFRDASRVLASLHRLAPADVGADAEPVVGAAAEIDRWCATLQTVDRSLAPDWPDTAEALRTGVPAPMGPGIVHGDFRLGNLLAVDGSVTGVIDWEIWSVGDPRIDLGWFLVNADPATYSRPSPHVGAVPSRDELLERYGAVADVAWFMALACFKSAATWGLIVKHNRRRTTPRPELEAMAPVLPELLARARTLLA
ncbi:phosphotransferase family protein [Mycobacterium sp. CPCC 205372]|uniref:Phosphotransferase family protein n=1 Tax=Mycobacterium hippophais TaxID=3016340 RepID=A0ABT4PUU6_9MYCO|nr:phosphotransferase family protein [Mycobacterium hippophais]MCZ8380329.1 phosphotransferase family protein [Mycobacterium hippophais]